MDGWEVVLVKRLKNLNDIVRPDFVRVDLFTECPKVIAKCKEFEFVVVVCGTNPVGFIRSSDLVALEAAKATTTVQEICHPLTVSVDVYCSPKLALERMLEMEQPLAKIFGAGGTDFLGVVYQSELVGALMRPAKLG
jgi:hypothetical protein